MALGMLRMMIMNILFTNIPLFKNYFREKKRIII